MSDALYESLFAVFPAHAGMSPMDADDALIHARFPRPRGDEPTPWSTLRTLRQFSPPTRG